MSKSKTILSGNSKQIPNDFIQKKLQMKEKLTRNQFVNQKEIGHGAFGKVYQATFTKNGKDYALKKISKKQIKTNNMMTQISNQIQISKRLQHPNIIKLYDYFDDQNDIFLVLELAKGGQLYSKLMRNGRFDEEQTKRMTRQIVSAVKYLHQNKIIHRDIKPQNILLDKKNNIKLADFGWSNFAGDKPRKTYCGTVDYLAPQMIDKSGHDQKLDIWCLGVLIYELLTGKTPFVTQNAKGHQKKRIIQQNILNMNISFPNDFPILAKGFVMSMIKRDPKQRLSLEQIQNHQWLKETIAQKSDQLPVMSKKPPRQIINIDSSNSQIVQQLSRKNKQLQQQISLLKINNQMKAQNKLDASTSQTEISNMMKQLRRLKPLQHKVNTLQKDYDQLWENINKKDKEIILLKSELKRVDDLREELERTRLEKKKFQEKVKKVQKELNQTKRRETELKDQLNQVSSNVLTKIKTGTKLDSQDVTSPQFAAYIEEELHILGQKFQQSKKILIKVLEKQRISKEKQQQLGKLKAQQKDIKQIIKSQLKQQFQNQKDQILLNARKQLAEERDRWIAERQRLKQIYQEGQNSNDNQTLKGTNKQEDLQLQLNTVKQLNQYYEKTISEQNFRIKDLENQLKRKK